MKALVKKERAIGLVMQEVQKPVIGPKEVLIKVTTSSICGTDIHIWKWDAWAQKTIPVPMVVGHEFVGTIVEIGSAITQWKVGQRVCGEGHITCGICPGCRQGKRHLCANTKGVGVHRPGSFAEYLSLPEENVFAIPDTIPNDLAAIFDPFGNAVHTALSFDLCAQDVLITGAGPIGIMACAIAKHAGARHVVATDINPYRLDLAKKMGATTVVNVSEESLAQATKNLGLSYGYTVGLEMSGHPQGFQSLLEQMQPGGKVALLGILPPGTVIDWDLVIFKMLEIKGIYGREIFSTWHKMVQLLEGGLSLSPIITHRYPIEAFEKGFDAMLSGQCGKVLLQW